MFDACALQLGARATAISNGRAGESTLLSQHGDFVQASVALCITVPDGVTQSSKTPSIIERASVPVQALGSYTKQVLRQTQYCF